jgi:hypothetical protein
VGMLLRQLAKLLRARELASQKGICLPLDNFMMGDMSQTTFTFCLFHFSPMDVRSTLDKFLKEAESQLKEAMKDAENDLKSKTDEFESSLKERRQLYSFELEEAIKQMQDEQDKALSEVLEQVEENQKTAQKARNESFASMKNELLNATKEAKEQFATKLKATTTKMRVDADKKKAEQLKRIQAEATESMKEAVDKLVSSMKRGNVNKANEIKRNMMDLIAQEDLKVCFQKNLLEVEKASAYANAQADVLEFEAELTESYAKMFEESARQHQELLRVKNELLVELASMTQEAHSDPGHDQGVGLSPIDSPQIKVRRESKKEETSIVNLSIEPKTWTPAEMAMMRNQIHEEAETDKNLRKAELRRAKEDEAKNRNEDIQSTKKEIDEMEEQVRSENVESDKVW